MRRSKAGMVSEVSLDSGIASIKNRDQRTDRGRQRMTFRKKARMCSTCPKDVSSRAESPYKPIGIVNSISSDEISCAHASPYLLLSSQNCFKCSVGTVSCASSNKNPSVSWMSMIGQLSNWMTVLPSPSKYFTGNWTKEMSLVTNSETLLPYEFIGHKHVACMILIQLLSQINMTHDWNTVVCHVSPRSYNRRLMCKNTTLTCTCVLIGTKIHK